MYQDRESLALVGCLAIIAIIPIAIIVNGLLISYGWHELILPIFPTMPNLSTWQAMGVSTFVSLFTSGLATRKGEGEGLKAAFASVIFVWLLELFMIWAISMTY